MNHGFWVITPRYLDITPRVQKILAAMQEDPACRYTYTTGQVRIGGIFVGTSISCEGNGFDVKDLAKRLAQHFKEMNITTWALAGRSPDAEGWAHITATDTGRALFDEVKGEKWSDS